jgi:hypothetical protein
LESKDLEFEAKEHAFGCLFDAQLVKTTAFGLFIFDLLLLSGKRPSSSLLDRMKQIEQLMRGNNSF